MNTHATTTPTTLAADLTRRLATYGPHPLATHTEQGTRGLLLYTADGGALVVTDPEGTPLERLEAQQYRGLIAERYPAGTEPGEVAPYWFVIDFLPQTPRGPRTAERALMGELLRPAGLASETQDPLTDDPEETRLRWTQALARHLNEPRLLADISDHEFVSRPPGIIRLAWVCQGLVEERSGTYRRTPLGTAVLILGQAWAHTFLPAQPTTTTFPELSRDDRYALVMASHLATMSGIDGHTIDAALMEAVYEQVCRKVGVHEHDTLRYV